MRRSSAPSQVLLATSSPKPFVANKENKLVSRPAVAQVGNASKKPKLANNQDANTKTDDSVVSLLENSQGSQDSHDDSIEKILKKPFRIPIFNYNGPTLGRLVYFLYSK